MGPIEAIKGKFALKNSSADTEIQPKTNILEEIEHKKNTLKTYEEWGFEQAGSLLGVGQGLLPCLQRVYRFVIEKIEEDKEEQGRRKSEIKAKINNLESDNNTKNSKIKNETENLKREEGKIDELIREIEDIRNHPEKITKDPTTKLGFIVGLTIITFLTIYLFIFYSSASFSAFFKQFTLDSGIVESIFDPKALQIAWQNGFTELILILTIPFVFLGLGYLIHKFGEEKGFFKYLKITGLVVVTFIFDFILAYEIVEKIYNIQKSNTFQTMPDMTLSMAAQQVNFWLIIFSGFIVYIIWGFVFSFVMTEYAKMDQVKVVLEIKENRLAERKRVCTGIRTRIEELEKIKNDNDAKIKTLIEELEKPIVFKNDVEEPINAFYTGWLRYMTGAHRSENDINECAAIKNGIINEIRSRGNLVAIQNN